MQKVHVVEWVNKLSERLKEMMQVVCEKERLAKERMKKHYDKKAKLREFNEGVLVLVRTPDLAGKLEAIWEYPYDIIRRISCVLSTRVIDIADGAGHSIDGGWRREKSPVQG